MCKSMTVISMACVYTHTHTHLEGTVAGMLVSTIAEISSPKFPAVATTNTNLSLCCWVVYNL